MDNDPLFAGTSRFSAENKHNKSQMLNELRDHSIFESRDKNESVIIQGGQYKSIEPDFKNQQKFNNVSGLQSSRKPTNNYNYMSIEEKAAQEAGNHDLKLFVQNDSLTDKSGSLEDANRGMNIQKLA